MSDEIFQPISPNPPVEKIPYLLTSSDAQGSPGPAAYSRETNILDNLPKVSFHGRCNQSEDINRAPYHDLGSTIGKGPKYSFPHKQVEKVEVNPGPEYVPPKFGLDAHSPVIHTRPSQRSIEVTPGPGQYNSTTKLGSKMGLSFHGPHERLVIENDISPGPSAYSPCMPQNKPSSPRYKIGSRYQDNKTVNTPGPGAYDLPGFQANRNQGVIGNRSSVSARDVTPSAADYQSTFNILKELPPIHFHGKHSESKEQLGAPYQNTTRPFGSQSPRYSMRSRYNHASTESTPAGTYVPPAFGTSSARVHICSRYQSKRSESTPGPGQYETKELFGNESPRHAFHGIRRSDPESISPGPAAYATCSSTLSKKGIKIKGSRYQPKTEPTGEYVNLGSTFHGPKFTMSPRCKLDVSFG